MKATFRTSEICNLMNGRVPRQGSPKFRLQNFLLGKHDWKTSTESSGHIGEQGETNTLRRALGEGRLKVFDESAVAIVHRYQNHPKNHLTFPTREAYREYVRTWAAISIFAVILTTIISGHLAKWEVIEAYRQSTVVRTAIYDNKQHEIVTTTIIHVPHEQEKVLPWLTNPKTLSQRILCGFPTITIVERTPCAIDNPNGEESLVEPEEESSPNTPVPEPQHFDPNAFVVK